MENNCRGMQYREDFPSGKPYAVKGSVSQSVKIGRRLDDVIFENGFALAEAAQP